MSSTEVKGEGRPSEAAQPSATLSTRAAMVIMYAQDGAGLGHMRRCANVAAAVTTRQEGARVVIAGRSLAAAAAFELPPHCDVLKLPSFAQLGDDASGERRVLADAEDAAFGRLRSRLLVDLVAELRPRAILVDNEPRGLGGEMMAALTLARREGLAGRIVCGLRDIRGRADYVVPKWQRDGTAAALAELYDTVLVYGDPEFYDTRSEYGLGTTIAVDVVQTGYLFDDQPRRSPETVRRELQLPEAAPIVAVTAGSGADGGRLLAMYLAEVAVRLPAAAVSVIVAGPLMPAAEFEALRRVGSGTCRVVRSYDNLSLVAAASAVVCQAGYNSILEATHLGHRPLVVPRQTRSGEQETRAEVFARRGLCEVLLPDGLDAAALSRMVTSQLERPRASSSPFRPAESAARAAELLLG